MSPPTRLEGFLAGTALNLGSRRRRPLPPPPKLRKPSPPTSIVCRADPLPPPPPPDPFPFSLPPPPFPTSVHRSISIPISYYAVLGADPQSPPDDIIRCYESKLSLPIHPGFSHDALCSRRKLLDAARDTLSDPARRAEYDRALSDPALSADRDAVSDSAGRAEYDRDTLSDPALSADRDGIHVPWDDVPGALCVLLELGQTQLLLLTAHTLLLERPSDPLKDDLMRSMVLTYVSLYKEAIAVDTPDYLACCELLERALHLLKFLKTHRGGESKTLTDIEVSLQAILPHCAIKLIALPLLEENRPRRKEGVVRVQKILLNVFKSDTSDVGGGFTRKDFVNKAFLHLTASEQVELLSSAPIDTLEWKNVHYQLALALIAKAFVHKKPSLVKEADAIFAQLQKTAAVSDFSKGVLTEFDFAFERALCALVTGDLADCQFWLGIVSEASPYRDTHVIEFLKKKCNFQNTNKLLQSLCLLLEIWLLEFVFPMFPDTRDAKFKLKQYYLDTDVLRQLKQKDGKGVPAVASARDNEKDGKRVPPLLTASRNESKSKAIKTIILIGGVVMFGFVAFKYGPGRTCMEAVVNQLRSTVSTSLCQSDGNLLQSEPKMDLKVAEALINKWQTVKSQALGEEHCSAQLPEVLGGEMLKNWADRAGEFAKRGWIMKFKPLGVSIERLTVSWDGCRATVEVTIKEAVWLIDPVNPVHNDFVSTSYTVQYVMCCTKLGWKITEGAVLTEANG